MGKSSGKPENCGKGPLSVRLLIEHDLGPVEDFLPHVALTMSPPTGQEKAPPGEPRRAGQTWLDLPPFSIAPSKHGSLPDGDDIHGVESQGIDPTEPHLAHSDLIVQQPATLLGLPKRHILPLGGNVK